MDEDNSIVDDILKDKHERANEDMDNILKELPVEVPKVNQTIGVSNTEKERTSAPTIKVPKKKFRLFKKKSTQQLEQLKPQKSKFKKLLPFVVLVVALLIITLTINPSSDCPETIDVVNTSAAQTLVDSIQSQIISKGYAEIVNGDITIKLAPYTG